jgi:hypothetical protein
MQTLRKLITEHPEWSDLPIVVYRPDGTLWYIGANGLVYPSHDHEEKIDVLVFSPN